MSVDKIAIGFGIIVTSCCAFASDYKFDPMLIDYENNNVDVSVFERGEQFPGVYKTDVIISGERVDTLDIAFSSVDNGKGKTILSPCLSYNKLVSYNINVDDIPELASVLRTKDDKCYALPEFSSSLWDYDFNSQTLTLKIPQIYISQHNRGEISPQNLWDDGITAAILNYKINSTRNQYVGTDRNDISNYINLAPGLNFGAWRVRNTTSWQESGHQKGKWQSANTYAEHGINSINSRITLGEKFTPSEIFSGIPFRGVMLSSDEHMVANNQSTFSPTIRGIARTQARVDVKQDGYIVYSEVVSPGPFSLSNLSMSGGGGDLQVTVWETDGHPQIFTVPFQTPALAVSSGYLKYNLMAGQYREGKEPVFQATAMYGLPWDLTIYGGVQAAEYYKSASYGLGLSMGGWGALSVDMTQSQGTKQQQSQSRGQAIRARYNKQLISTNTNFTMASAQYASSGFSSLGEVLDSYQHDVNGFLKKPNKISKNNTSLSVSQSLNKWGMLNLSGYYETYWNATGNSRNYNIGYTLPIKDMSISLNYSESHYAGSTSEGTTDRITSLWLSIPLSRWAGGNVSASYRYTHPSQSGDSHSVGMYGSASDRQLNWSASQQYRPDSEGNKNNGNLNLSWTGAYGQIGGNYSYSGASRQEGVDISGGIVAHSNGVTFSQPLENTVALIEAQGANGLKVNGFPGNKTDGRGYTTQSYLTPYQNNMVSVDPSNAPEDVEITQTDTRVVPTEGAVVTARFPVSKGGRALITLELPGLKGIPYGAVVSTTIESPTDINGIVGDNSEVYMTGLAPSGELIAKWKGHQCKAVYKLPESKNIVGIYRIHVQCVE